MHPGWHQYVAEAFELLILLHTHLESWNFSHDMPHATNSCFQQEFLSWWCLAIWGEKSDTMKSLPTVITYHWRSHWFRMIYKMNGGLWELGLVMWVGLIISFDQCHLELPASLHPPIHEGELCCWICVWLAQFLCAVTGPISQHFVYLQWSSFLWKSSQCLLLTLSLHCNHRGSF